MTTPNSDQLENRLYRWYRRGMYGFGVVVGAAIISGTWLGLQMVQKHDQVHRPQTQVKVSERGENSANPFQEARTVEFKLPYMHGANAYTLRYMSQLAQNPKTTNKNGFVVEAEYRSGSIKQKIDLNLSCEHALCEMSFKMPSRLVLTPRYDGRRFVYPQREFEVHAQDIVFEVEKSKLVGIAKNDAKEMALFDSELNLKPYYKEFYFDREGKWLKAKG